MRMTDETTNRIATNHDPILNGERERVPASDSDSSPNIAAASSAALRFKIPGDTIARTCKDLTDDQRAALNWAANFCRSRNMSHADLAKLLKKPGSEETYDPTSVFHAFTGGREPGSGSMERFAQAVHTLRRRIEETEARSSVAFVETATYRTIERACQSAFKKKRIGFILGETQTGKSRCANEYAKRHNHGETKYFRIPAGGNYRDFLLEMADVLGISGQLKSYEMQRRIMNCFDERTLVIIDEGEQCLDSKGGMRIIEFLREIWDRRKCGLVIIGALNFRNALHGNTVNYTLKKLSLRGIRPIVLPSRPSEADLDQFAAAFGLDPAPDADKSVKAPSDVSEFMPEVIKGNPRRIQAEVIRDFGLGRWLATLEEARDLAEAASGQMTWGRVILAHALFNQDPV